MNVSRYNRKPSLPFRGITLRTEGPEGVGNKEGKGLYKGPKDDLHCVSLVGCWRFSAQMSSVGVEARYQVALARPNR